MEHKVLETKLHCITDSKGVVHVYRESEYQHIEWWIKMKIKYKLN